MWLFAILVAPAVLLAASSWRGERDRFRYYRERLRDQTQSTFLPPVSLIVPVKGHDQGLQENLASLADLDYPDYELIIAARAPADVPPDVTPPKVRLVFSKGQPSGAAEKLQNLLAAVRAVQPQTEVLAFADSDGRVSRGWLRALVAPLPAGAGRLLARLAQRVERGDLRHFRSRQNRVCLGRRHGPAQRFVLPPGSGIALGQHRQ
jgi:ceramide glucosyltransferase